MRACIRAVFIQAADSGVCAVLSTPIHMASRSARVAYHCSLRRDVVVAQGGVGSQQACIVGQGVGVRSQQAGVVARGGVGSRQQVLPRWH